MNNQYRIAQVGTFDLENFGDLLFPKILSHELEKRLGNVEIELFSSIGGSMPFNGHPVYAIDELESRHLFKPFHAIIIGGGDIIRLDANVAKNELYPAKNSTYNLWVLPILVSQRFGIPVLMNAPGVPFSFNSEESDLVRVFISCVDYCCVRDETSQTFLKKAGVQETVNVIPDSAWAVEDTYTPDHLDKEFISLSKRLAFPEKYVLLQLGSLENDIDPDTYKNAINHLEELFHCPVVLMPIGYMHNDSTVFSEIKSHMMPECRYIDDKLSPVSMLAVIKHSSCFVGTSLHGNLTAQMFGVPSVAINNSNLAKIRGMMQMIDMECYHLDSIGQVLALSEVHPMNIKHKQKILNTLSRHFDLIAERIENPSEVQVCTDILPVMIEWMARSLTLEKKRMVMGCVYFDFGGDFSQANKKLFSVDFEDPFFHWVIDLPSNLKRIRIHPVEGYHCIVRDFKVAADSDILPITAINGTVVENDIMFNTDDPQILVDIPAKNYSRAQISGIVIPLEKRELSECFVSIAEQINRYEVDKKALQTVNEHQLATIQKLEKRLLESQNYTLKLEFELSKKNQNLHDLIEQSRSEAAILSSKYNSVINSKSWKITLPLRSVLNILRRIPICRIAYKAAVSIRHSGFRGTLKKIPPYLRNRKATRQKRKKPLIPLEHLLMQTNFKFDKDIKFSIIVPLYNTPIEFLIEMILSVLNQSYKNWELCLADGSDENGRKVGKICRRYVKKDKRIKYKKLEKNEGISENTNHAIRMATGDYIALFDHDDMLHPSALFEYMNVICNENADFIYCDELTFEENLENIIRIHYKMDFSPDSLRAINYITHFSVFKKELLEKVGLLKKEFDGSQDHDLILRLTEKAENIVHIPKVLYFWRSHSTSVANSVGAKPYAVNAGVKSVESHLERVGLKGEVYSGEVLNTIYRIKYEIKGEPLVSILIPNKDHVNDLSKCINSIKELSSYKNYEIIIIENNSKDNRTFEYYKALDALENVRVIMCPSYGTFNYSKINNFGIEYANGEHLLFLNNDVEVISEDWIQEMLMFSQRDDVGAVGAMLYYPNETIQHAGVILGLGGVAGHSHKGFARHNKTGYFGRLLYQQNLSAVTAACMMVRKSVFSEVKGFNEEFAVAFNDVDLCMRIRKQGYLIVWTPYAELYHHESISRGCEDTPEKIERFGREIAMFKDYWGEELQKGDPYYNINLTRAREDFSYMIEDAKRRHQAIFNK